MKSFLGLVVIVGTPLGVLVHSSPDWSQGWVLDVLVGWLFVAAVTAVVLALEEV